ncbi:interferon lambda receptor 1 [Pteronotus mesoamericanus]|uniref:interferon lambda receptor 1 n=1 Tax=Pteronotus mesoamericanus TaxID=1884717 RepID=UPI0023EC7E02|nr:interferon lambda receptor 1 [Pteronotus parnellii mesoamericanus]
MSPAGRWALLLLCLLASAGGRPHLAPPQNVSLLSQNFSVYLTWLPGPGNPQDVTYLVAYHSFTTTPRRWRKVEKCAATKELTCCLMCLEKQDLFNKFKGRVRVVSPLTRSPWVESNYLEYLFEVEPAPPILEHTVTGEILKVNATYHLPHCMPSLNLQYQVDFWKERTGYKTRFPATPHGQEVQIPLQLAARGSHCVSARTIYILGDPKYSEFSKPTCFSLETPGVHWAFLVLLPLLLVIPVGCVIWKSCVMWKSFTGNPWFQRAERPQALDFSGHRRPVATYQPCGPESLDNLTLCPQKELTRRIPLTSRVRAPATIQAGSEKDSAKEEDDEEDTDDNVSFQAYIAPPHFLEQGHHTPGQPEQGVQVEGCPAWDSSDRSWASTVCSAPTDEAGSSGYLAKEGPGRELDEDGCQDPLLLPKFSEDLSSLEELQRDDLSSWADWGSSSPRLHLVPGEPLVSFQTLTFAWDSSAGEEEEEEEEEEEGGGGGSELEHSSTGSWGTDSLWRTKASGRTLGHYMAR